MRSGFSLVELLVVIAIVGVLAGVAVPAYRQYQVRVKVANAVILVSAKLKEIAQYYERNGTWPATTNFLGATLSPGWWAIPPNSSDITQGTYGPSTDGRAITMTVYVSASVVGSSYGAFAVILRNVNGAFKQACGPAWFPANNLPFSLLPASCSCNNMGSFWNDGSGGC